MVMVTGMDLLIDRFRGDSRKRECIGMEMAKLILLTVARRTVLEKMVILVCWNIYGRAKKKPRSKLFKNIKRKVIITKTTF